MSIIDLILGQKIILLSIAFTGVVLVAAVSLFMYLRIRRAMAKRPHQGKKATATMAEMGNLGSPEDVPFPVTQADIEPPEAASEPFTQVQAAQSQAAVVQHQPQTASLQPAGEPAASPESAAIPQAQGESSSAENVVSSAMQDLISSVFSDEDAQARYAVLLAGTDNVAAEELANLSSNVAQQLRAKFGSVAE